jgi:DNA-binding MarR family transcriptional regulator
MTVHALAERRETYEVAPRVNVGRLLSDAAKDRELTPTGLRVLVLITEYYNRELGYAWPSQGTLADVLGVTRQAISKATIQLETRGYLEIEHTYEAGSKERATSRYRFPSFYRGSNAALLPRREVATPGAEGSNAALPPPAEVATPRCMGSNAPLHKPGPNEPTYIETYVSTPPGEKKPTVEQVGYRDLSEPAREFIDDWRAKQGRTRPPKLNPALAKTVEDAVADLGLDRLKESNTWAAERQIPELIKAIRAARTRRKQEEDHAASRGGAGGVQGPAGGPRGNGVSPAGGLPNPFAKYR